MSEVWYHKSLTRLEAEKKLLRCERDGTFLIRKSETIGNSVVISLLFRDEVYHFKIPRMRDGRFYVESNQEDKYFDTLADIVHYYKQPRICMLPCPLVYPYSVHGDEPLTEGDYVELTSSHDYEELDDTTELSHDWILDRNNIVLSSAVVREGEWGKVLKGTYCGRKVAVKEIHKLLLTPYNRAHFEREMTIASKCRHPCLLQFIGATNDDKAPLLVTELMDTSLRAVLHERALTPKEITNIALDVANGLHYLHLKRPDPIIHRDISSANVLLWKNGADWRAKLSDYGAADFLRDSMTACSGAAIYSAPEALTSRQSPKVDVYSFGVLFCEMNIREQPDEKIRNDQVARVANGFHRHLICRCLLHNPDERPSMGDVIKEMTRFEQWSGV